MIRLLLFVVSIVLILMQVLTPVILFFVDNDLYNRLYSWASAERVGPRGGTLGASYVGILVVWLVFTLYFRPRKKHLAELKNGKREKLVLQIRQAETKKAAIETARRMFLQFQQYRTEYRLVEMEQMCTPACWTQFEQAGKRRKEVGLRYRFSSTAAPKIRILDVYDQEEPSFTAMITGKAIDGIYSPAKENKNIRPAAYRYYIWINQKLDPPRIRYFSKGRYRFYL